MNFELFFSISAHRLPCNFRARTCMIAHEKSPRIYGYIDYSTNIPACQLFFSINFHITFINPRICELPTPEKCFFKGNFSEQASGGMQGGGEKVAKRGFCRRFSRLRPEDPAGPPQGLEDRGELPTHWRQVDLPCI